MSRLQPQTHSLQLLLSPTIYSIIISLDRSRRARKLIFFLILFTYSCLQIVGEMVEIWFRARDLRLDFLSVGNIFITRTFIINWHVCWMLSKVWLNTPRNTKEIHEFLKRINKILKVSGLLFSCLEWIFVEN